MEEIDGFDAKYVREEYTKKNPINNQCRICDNAENCLMGIKHAKTIAQQNFIERLVNMTVNSNCDISKIPEEMRLLAKQEGLDIKFPSVLHVKFVLWHCPNFRNIRIRTTDVNMFD